MRQKMKKFLFLLAAVAVLTSCVQLERGGKRVAKKMPLNGFERIEVNGVVDVKYVQSDSFFVRVSAPERLASKVTARVEGRQLIVGSDGADGQLNLQNLTININHDDGIVFYVGSPDLTAVTVNGSGDFECEQRLDTDRLSILLKGSGDVEFHDIICDHITVSLIGSGDVEVKHVEAQTSSVELIGSGDVEMGLYKVGETRLQLRGSGDIEASFADCRQVEAHIAGSGDIELKGDVDRLTSSVAGSGDLHTKKLRVKK